ncbi:DUF3352 domain-containing protein [bacterium]|nr:DUF3352 domain-containing protein [bacterium]
MKKGLRIILIMSAIGLVFWLYYRFSPNRNIDPFNLIPADAIYILESEDPIENWTEFSKSKFWSFLKTQTYLEDLTEDANYLDSLISGNQKLLKHFGEHHFIMSAHMTLSRDYDYLFGFDLKKASKLDLVPLLSEYALDKKEFKITQREFLAHTIVEIHDLATKDILYLSQVQNYLMCSYNPKILEKSISEHSHGPIAGNIKFREVYKEIDTDGLARFYFNYKYLDEFSSVYLSDIQSLTQSIESELSFSGFDLNLDEDRLNITGYSSIADIEDSYLRLVRKHGNASINSDRILSNRTAYVQFLCLNDFRSFYRDLKELRQKENSNNKELEDLQNQVESILKLSLDEDILSWIGNEIALAYNAPDGRTYGSDDLVLVLKCNNRKLAEEKLEKIQAQIKKRTPARFKSMSFKSYKIQYLELKGLFNLFLGKAFGKIDRPYYTLVEDYVVFSNSPKTLVSLLEDYENDRVLKEDALFAEVKEEIYSKPALFSYFNGGLSYPVLEQKVSSDKKTSYAKNKAYFQFFNAGGIAFKAESQGFENQVFLKFGDEISSSSYDKGHLDSVYNHYFIDIAQTLKTMNEADKFILEKVQDGTYYRYYPNTKNIQIEAETEDGLLDGRYKEFYINGKRKIVGKYKKGKKSGIWKFYNEEGKLEERSWEFLKF